MISNPGSVGLERCRFAVVDVETTGARVERGGRIIEVAVAILEDGTVHLAYEAVLDPEARIPSWVTRLTGITERDVAGRPRFSDVATDLGRTLEDGVFVAQTPASIGAISRRYGPRRVCPSRRAASRFSWS